MKNKYFELNLNTDLKEKIETYIQNYKIKKQRETERKLNEPRDIQDIRRELKRTKRLFGIGLLLITILNILL